MPPAPQNLLYDMPRINVYATRVSVICVPLIVCRDFLSSYKLFFVQVFNYYCARVLFHHFKLVKLLSLVTKPLVTCM